MYIQLVTRFDWDTALVVAGIVALVTVGNALGALAVAADITSATYGYYAGQAACNGIAAGITAGNGQNVWEWYKGAGTSEKRSEYASELFDVTHPSVCFLRIVRMMHTLCNRI